MSYDSRAKKPACSSRYRLRFIEPGLVSIFGELVKYNCVILYKAVLGWQRPQKLHYSAFYWGVKKGTFSWWWITSLSHEVKVKHTRVGGGGGGGGGVLRWTYMDHLKWNQFSWRIRAGCHNGFYLTPINTCIDLLVGSNPARTEGWVGGRGERKKKLLHTQILERRQSKCSMMWHLLIHHGFIHAATHLQMQGNPA